MSRHAREPMPPAEYLATGSYEHWLYGLERLLVDRGLLTQEEIDRRAAAISTSTACASRSWRSEGYGGRRSAGPEPRHGAPAEAVDGVVVHHPHRLHEGVADRGPHEAKAALHEILAHRLRLVRLRGDLLR